VIRHLTDILQRRTGDPEPASLGRSNGHLTSLPFEDTSMIHARNPLVGLSLILVLVSVSDDGA
jgi:hypothetical protein